MDELDRWLQPQTLQQEGQMDCGVAVFAKLANLTEERILSDMPEAANGMTPEHAERYLKSKGLKVTRYESGDKHPLPCAHLVESSPHHYHWIFQAEDGGIHDPSPACQHCPPHYINQHFDAFYRAKVLTLAVG